MSVIGSNVLAGASGNQAADEYLIQKSLRFSSGDSAHLSRTPSSAGNRKTWTFSTWCKIATPEKAGILLNAQNGTNQGFANNFWILFYAGTVVVGDGSVDYLNTAKLRDPSAWYHIVVTCDTTQSAASDKLKIYINGVESVYTGDARSSITTDSLTAINSTYLHRIGDSGSYHAYFDGLLADTQLIDGQALAPTDFGEFDADTGVWNPIEFTGSYTQNSPNDGTTWSSYWTGNLRSTGLYGPDDSFDGDNNQTYPSSGAGNNCTWTVPTAFPSTDTIEIYIEAGADHPVTIHAQIILLMILRLTGYRR